MYDPISRRYYLGSRRGWVDERAIRNVHAADDVRNVANKGDVVNTKPKAGKEADCG